MPLIESSLVWVFILLRRCFGAQWDIGKWEDQLGINSPSELAIHRLEGEPQEVALATIQEREESRFCAFCILSESEYTFLQKTVA